MYLIDYRLDKRLEVFLEKNNIDYITTMQNKDLYVEIDGHSDIVACNIDDVTVIEPRTYEKIYDEIKNYNVVKGDTILKNKYPYDIAYNVVITEKYLFGNIKYIDNQIKQIALKKNIEFINVKQGYTRCSTIVTPNILITSDTNIYETAKEKNINIYYVKIDDIYLSKRYNGFLGGACTYINDTLIFFGNIEKSKSFCELDKILNKNNIKYVCAFDDKLYDYGSMIQIK